MHELTGHGILKIGSNQHGKILQMQRRHISWKHVTSSLRKLYQYLEEYDREYAK